MLLGNREKNPQVMIRIGMGIMPIFFVMGLLPHPTSSLGDGLYDGIRGALMGVASTLLLWATYLNGQRRRHQGN